MSVFNKSKIKNNFNKAALNYDDYAVLQKEVAKKLVNLSSDNINKSNKILDLGSGTGFVADSIKSTNKEIFELDIAYNMLDKRPGSLKVNADIEYLPFVENSFDLILSSLAFQWLNNISLAITNCGKVLKDNGSLIFSIITDGSLAELKSSCTTCGVNLSINQFPTKQYLVDIISDISKNYQLIDEKIILEYKDLYDLLNSMKKIGASYGSNFNRNNLTKKQFELLNSFYLKNFNSKDRIFATWQVTYVFIKYTKSKSES